LHSNGWNLKIAQIGFHLSFRKVFGGEGAIVPYSDFQHRDSAPSLLSWYSIAQQERSGEVATGDKTKSVEAQKMGHGTGKVKK